MMRVLENYMFEISAPIFIISLLLACIAGGGLGLWLSTVLVSTAYRRATENFKPVDTGKEFDPTQPPPFKIFPGGSAGEKPPIELVCRSERESP